MPTEPRDNNEIGNVLPLQRAAPNARYTRVVDIKIYLLFNWNTYMLLCSTDLPCDSDTLVEGVTIL